MKPPKKFELNFVLAGYSRRFNVDVDDSVPRDHPAYEILQHFDGLHIHPNLQSGIECAPADIAFQLINSIPQLAAEWQTRLETSLIGIALVAGGNDQLWVSTNNKFYMTSNETKIFGEIGDSFDEVIENLLEGRKLRELEA